MDKVDVASDTQMCLPVVFDFVTREVIWANIALTGNPRWVSNVAGNLRGVSKYFKQRHARHDECCLFRVGYSFQAGL
ncbi:hypothetical protein [Limnoglobus roseus]|uniref:hypothetical protein n=1 Tax=Limnoglobus roseus TaxID=2598579 RepID=UPI0011EB133E|nr:hypothetical protein [Limnoglobus roseus]